MRRGLHVAVMVAMLLYWQLASSDGYSEQVGEFIIDTMYARVTLGDFSQPLCDPACAACDLIVKYRFRVHPGTVNSISIGLVGTGREIMWDFGNIESMPADCQRRDSLRAPLPCLLGGLQDTAYVLVKFSVFFYETAGRLGAENSVVSRIDCDSTMAVPVGDAQ